MEEVFSGTSIYILIIAALSWSMKLNKCNTPQIEVKVPSPLSLAEQDRLLLSQCLTDKKLMV